MAKSTPIPLSQRLLEEQEAKLAHLREALIEGEQSGPAAPFDADAFLARLHAEHLAKA